MSEQEFNDFAAKVKNLKTQPSNDQLLKLYGLYKQATVGNVNTARPGMFDLKGKAKWDAWKALENTSTEEARKQYIQLVQELIAELGLN